MKKDGTLGEDEERGAEGHLQKITDRQWPDAFGAGNDNGDVTTRYIARIRQKIDEGLRLP